uniref:Transcriptional activator protein n=1 Tax=Wissadula yellow mosaic virus TaxID=1904884 RepID=A0A1D8GV89_9GEMI|nr:trans-activating protein [Wissadula yellow mosaic virus]
MPSLSLSTPPCIKKAHRQAKRRAIRRRRIDLECGCSIYLHINCAEYGYTHRGTHHCASSGEWRLYLGNNKSPVFQDVQGRGPSIHNNKGLPCTNTVQPQLEESIASPQSIPELPNLDDIPDSFWADLFS